jgi:hypothetical protein
MIFVHIMMLMILMLTMMLGNVIYGIQILSLCNLFLFNLNNVFHFICGYGLGNQQEALMNKKNP